MSIITLSEPAVAVSLAFRSVWSSLFSLQSQTSSQHLSSQASVFATNFDWSDTVSHPQTATIQSRKLRAPDWLAQPLHRHRCIYYMKITHTCPPAKRSSSCWLPHGPDVVLCNVTVESRNISIHTMADSLRRVATQPSDPAPVLERLLVGLSCRHY